MHSYSWISGKPDPASQIPSPSVEENLQAVRTLVRDGLMPMPTTSRADGVNRAVRLTKREIEVLSLIAQGHSSKEAADALYVSKRTVDFHLANIYDKLQVNNRVQAFRAATRLGLIPFEPTFGHTRAES
jgi:DNA-binding CsgD family transcriptional regulator